MKLTREEAIKRFETLLLHVDTDCVMGMETTEAINMAIKALEQLEPCEDAISRKAAIDGKIPIQRANGVEIYSDEAVPVEYLKTLPSAQPEPCNYVNACIELAKNNTSSTYGYLQILKEFKKYGYILVDTMGNMR